MNIAISTLAVLGYLYVLAILLSHGLPNWIGIGIVISTAILITYTEIRELHKGNF